MIVNKDNLNSVMISSLSTISTSSSSSSSFEDTTSISQSKLVEEQSIFNEASLAQAEYDDDLKEDFERSKRSFSNFEFVDDEHSENLTNTENSKRSSFKNRSAHVENVKANSNFKNLQNFCNETKEYWATIDFYNNSKIAFNKRLKSVKLKREKLNFELNERKTRSFEKHKLVTNNINEPYADQDLCNCVKCTIIIHEALIQGLQNVHEMLCKRCHSKLKICRCNPSNENFNTKENTSSDNDYKKTLMNSDQKNISSSGDVSNFEEKLLNIKNELINLSETSLDVFHMLLQLSDTVLDLNNQLSSSTNVTQLFLSNSNSNLNQNLLAISENETESKPFQNLEKKAMCIESKSNKIDNFLKKKFYSTQSEVNPTNKDLNNSITSIINKINNRSNNQKIEHLKKVFSTKSSTNSPITTNNQSKKLIENICDKTSVTQFVDSLLNSKSGEDLSRASSGFYSATSLLTMINQEETSIASFSDTSHSFSIKQTPNIRLSSTTNNIIARQLKNPSSSNIDLSEAKSFRHSTLSTSSSNTDSLIEQTKFLTMQSQKSKDNDQTNSNVCGLATNIRKNSTSNNTLSSNSSCTSPVPNIIVNGVRKPSFKFENNTILNKVQNMNIKNKYLSPQNLNDISESSTLDKRCSLNRENKYDLERCSVKRQQSVKCQNTAKIPLRSESSLDSGINLTSENEESRTVLGVK